MENVLDLTGINFYTQNIDKIPALDVFLDKIKKGNKESVYKFALEIGCGYGEYTLAIAQKNPKLNVIGLDLKGDRIYQGASLAAGETLQLPAGNFSLEKPLPNAYFVRTIINPKFLSFIPANSIDQIWVTFPDPQPVNFKKQLTFDTFLMEYWRILSSGGNLILKTDNTGLFNQTLTRIKGDDFKDLFEMETVEFDLYKTELYEKNLLLQIKTRYEEKFTNLGEAIKYLRLVKKC